MNCPDDTPAGCLWCYPDNIAGEAAAEDDSHHRTSMFSEYYCNDDLVELVWQQGGGDSDVMMMGRAPVHEPEVLPAGPPPEDEMASWLSAIVRGEGHARDGDRTGWRTPPEKEFIVPSMATVTEGMGTKDTAGGSSEKAAAGGARRSHHGETHNLTEKKRRCKINERLKTLQQLIPGCDKSNHASTLDQTIQYMKRLQQQVQAMSVGLPPVRPSAVTTTAVYPVMQPPAGVVPVVLGPLPMAPFWPLMPCTAPYPAPAVLVPGVAAAPPLNAVPAPPAPATAGTGAANHQHGSSSSAVKGRRSSVQHKA